VPALLSDDKGIMWAESLAVMCQGKARPAPGCRGVAGDVRPTNLDAGQSVSSVVNILAMPNLRWPGGGRISFTFCLGNESVMRSFYYLERHHGPLRGKLQQ
jgi:hypothetical protein